jgi:hypothetical protein
MADVINFVSKEKVSSKKVDDYLEKAKAQINERFDSKSFEGGIFLLFEGHGNTEVILAGALEPGDCCLALERVKLQMISETSIGV